METAATGLEPYMLPCPIKAGIGLECPGCGIQRSLAALLTGDFEGAWHSYPALLPLLCSLGILVFVLKKQPSYGKWMLAGTWSITGIFIMSSYFYKMI